MRFVPILLILPAILVSRSLTAGEKDSSKVILEVRCDLVSGYVWRGSLASGTPNIQPALTLTAGNFGAGILASGDFLGEYREIDYWVSYTFRSFTFTINDYFWTPFFDSTGFFDYRYDKTGHFIDLALDWQGPASFPLKVTASTIVMGPDNRLDHYDAVTQTAYYENRYSAYLELSYPFAIGETELSPHAGFTPREGMYDRGAGLVDFGLKAIRNIRVGKELEIPLSAALILNPHADNAWFVVGLSF